MKQKFCILLLMFSFLTIVPNCTTAAKAANLTIDMKTVTKKGKKPYIEYQINSPSFHNFSNSKFQNKLNFYYKKSTDKFKNKLEKESQKYYKETKGSNTPFHPYVANVDYKVSLNKPPLLSLYVNYYQYTGGAHGLYTWKANTFDLNEKKLLHLDGLFQQKDTYKEVIRAEIVKQIKQNKSIYFPDAMEKVMSAKKFHFFLEQNNLVIYFPLYEIAPYASGIPQFRIPYTLLRDYLNPSHQNILIDNK
ncbi:ferritin [Bacillus cereus]|nr:ferritin [Bacillus cereus]PGU64148.1 ferritin [Bacillus cereus]